LPPVLHDAERIAALVRDRRPAHCEVTWHDGICLVRYQVTTRSTPQNMTHRFRCEERVAVALRLGVEHIPMPPPVRKRRGPRFERDHVRLPSGYYRRV